MSWGGRETLYSYGIKCGLNPNPDELFRLAGELKMAMPREHIELLESAELSHRSGDYYFVHAGVRPGTALEQQRFGLSSRGEQARIAISEENRNPTLTADIQS